jgi:hypothetical protein
LKRKAAVPMFIGRCAKALPQAPVAHETTLDGSEDCS